MKYRHFTFITVGIVSIGAAQIVSAITPRYHCDTFELRNDFVVFDVLKLVVAQHSVSHVQRSQTGISLQLPDLPINRSIAFKLVP